MSPDEPQTDSKVARTPRLALVILSGLVAASAAWGMGDGALGEPRVWGLVGFEGVVLLAGVLGMLIGLGRIREAPALGAACVAGAIFAATTLGRFSAINSRTDELLSEAQTASRLMRDPVFVGRALAAAVAIGLSVLIALGRSAVSWRSFLFGAGLAVPAALGAAWIIGPGKTWLLGGESAGGSMVRVLVGVFGGLALTLCIGAAVHFMIRAFELQMPEPPMPERKPAQGGAGGRKAKAAAPNKPV